MWRGRGRVGKGLTRTVTEPVTVMVVFITIYRSFIHAPANQGTGDVGGRGCCTSVKTVIVVFIRLYKSSMHAPAD